MKRLFFLLVTLISVSCSTSEENYSVQSITPITVGKGDLTSYPFIQPRQLVITNSADWAALRNEIDSYYIGIGLGNHFTNTFFQETTIDFTSFEAIVVIDQGYGNGGHSIDITSVSENQSSIIVTVQNLNTGGLTTVVTQPYHIVKIPISTKPVVFQ